MANKYLIVYKGLTSTVPRSLQNFVKTKIEDEFSSFDVELDFSGTRAGDDLVVKFENKMDVLPTNGESSRPDITNGSGKTVLAGESEIWARAIKTMRLQVSPGTCEPAFPRDRGRTGIDHRQLHDPRDRSHVGNANRKV